MFGLGFFEILIIFLVVIIFINPKDLPKVFRRLGRLVRQLRDIRDSSMQYMRKIEREIEEEDLSSEKEGESDPEQPDS
ncbi:MAG: twin-arginine translocase TatA/TatE family subunit [Spirochaetales bacterium]|nr:twin-arginine translocase TatA/TatE family subunit [Spirochaetales bacterium]